MFGFRPPFLLVLIVATQSQCGKWTLDNGETLDLSCLAYEQPYYALDGEYPPHNYIWNLCGNGVTENGCGSAAVMVAQTSRTDANACYVLGRWDESIMPTYSGAEGGTWTFRYDNGADDCGNPARTWAPTYVCSPGTIFEYGAVSEIPGSCNYELTIKTQYACKDSSYTCIDTCDDVYTVKVVNALDMDDTDVFSKSDPYVEVYAYEDNGRFQKVSTTVKENNDAPVWNEEFKFDSKRIGNSSYTAFRFKVWDDDKILGFGGADFLGESPFFHTEWVYDCNYVYAERFYLDECTLYVEVSKECCDAN